MNQITKLEYKSIKQIYHNLLFAYYDTDYLTRYGLNLMQAALIDQNQIFFGRIRYYLFHFTVIEFNKLFHSSEKYSITKYINYEIKNASDEQLKARLVKLKNAIKEASVKELIQRIKTIRNKSSAHLDPNRYDIKNPEFKFSEIELLLNLVNDFMVIFNVIVESTPYKTPITKDKLGYKLHIQYEKSITK